MPPPLSSPDRSKREFLDRLGTYFIGVAVGCVLLGILWMARARSAARQAAADAGTQADTSPADAGRASKPAPPASAPSPTSVR